MRNLFDQYKHPENRLTHALASCLASDTQLLRGFVRWACGESAPKGPLQIVEQQLPGEEEEVAEAITEEEANGRGLPDCWIHDGKSWALVLENKIQAPLRREQLDRHRRMAQRRGFSQARFVALVTQRKDVLSPGGVSVLEWRQLYQWLRCTKQTPWTACLMKYMEVLERKLPRERYLTEGTLTVFAGIPFGEGEPYNYLEAKRLLGQAMKELKVRKDLQRHLGINPEGKGRGAITGRAAPSVWDFLSLSAAGDAKNFTEFPHLTLSIQRDQLLVIVTVPNGIRREFRRRLLARDKEGLLEVFEDIHGRLSSCLKRVDGAVPWVEMVQRHYPSQRAEPVVDARLQFDLRTAMNGRGRWGKAVKRQPQWLDAVHAALGERRSNLQLAVGAVFPYDKCPAVRTRAILDHVAGVWLSCKPLLIATVG